MQTRVSMLSWRSLTLLYRAGWMNVLLLETNGGAFVDYGVLETMTARFNVIVVPAPPPKIFPPMRLLQTSRLPASRVVFVTSS